MKEEDPQKPWLRDLGLLGVITVDVVGYSGAGVAIGYLAWTKLGMPWWIVLLTSMGGLALAMYRVYQMSKRNSK